MTEGDRYVYPITLDSDRLIVDCGGFQGDWTARMIELYGCRSLVFEPVFTGQCRSRFDGNSKVLVMANAVGGYARTLDMVEANNSTGAYAVEGQTHNVAVMAIADVLNTDVAVLKLNIEGMEFEVLEAMIELRLLDKVENIQVQFHNKLFPGAQFRYENIDRELSKTHPPTWRDGWTWVNYERH